MISDKTIGRLSQYRRLIADLLVDDERFVFSHKLAEMAGGTAAQVRRDVMAIGYSGSPTKGYDLAGLAESIDNFLDAPEGTRAVLVGMGNLGRAITAYFTGRRPKLSIVAAFDNDSYRTGRVIHGCRCYPVEDIAKIVGDLDVRVGILTVPQRVAQPMADMLVQAGVSGILNFAPTRLRVPPRVYVEYIDMTTALEKVSYFGRNM